MAYSPYYTAPIYLSLSEGRHTYIAKQQDLLMMDTSSFFSLSWLKAVDSIRIASSRLERGTDVLWIGLDWISLIYLWYFFPRYLLTNL